MTDNTQSQPAPEGPQSASVDVERPSWLPEGFNSGEELAARYAEMERAQGGSGQSTDQPSDAPPATSSDAPANHSDAAVMVESAGLDFAALNQEFATKGSLSAQSYADLARAGITRDVVDGYIAGQTALAQDIKNQVFSVAGGPDAYADMIGWAQHAFSANEIEAFNATMNSGSTFQMALAVDGLKARFVAENGSAPALLGGNSGHGSQSAGDAFGSTAELTTAMKDPRYSSDPAYRKSVADRLARSSIM